MEKGEEMQRPDWERPAMPHCAISEDADWRVLAIEWCLQSTLALAHPRICTTSLWLLCPCAESTTVPFLEITLLSSVCWQAKFYEDTLLPGAVTFNVLHQLIFCNDKPYGLFFFWRVCYLLSVFCTYGFIKILWLGSGGLASRTQKNTVLLCALLLLIIFLLFSFC